MNKQEVIDTISDQLNYTKSSVEEIINAFEDLVKDQVADGEDVRLKNFGTFSCKKYQKSKFVNIHTGKRDVIASRWYPTFTPGKDFKDKVKE